MGTFRIPIEVGGPEGGRFETVDVLVDTGASYTALPGELLERLGVDRSESWPFQLADGRQVQMDIGDATVRVNGRATRTIVVFSEAGTALVGAYTLEGLRMAADPVRRQLVSVPGLLMGFDRSRTRKSPLIPLCKGGGTNHE